MTAIFEAKLLKEDDFKGFAAIYENFRERAAVDYKFELEPLGYEDFVDAIKQEFINCVVLYENGIPTAFLIYTTAISEAVELNIIHSIDSDNIIEKSNVLIRKFLELTKAERAQKVVCYPMLGDQKILIGNIGRFGFKFIGIVVLRFMTAGTNSREILDMAKFSELDTDYKIAQWSDEYFKKAVEVVHEAFEDSADALFDPRFKSFEGTQDIINKIVGNIYAEFLPETTSVLLYKDIPVGFCFMNLTGGTIANIPIVAIRKNHQGKGLSKHILKHSVQGVLELVDTGKKPITEINTTTETNNFQALKMYRHLGFKEDYNYPQAYLPIGK